MGQAVLECAACFLFAYLPVGLGPSRRLLAIESEGRAVSPSDTTSAPVESSDRCGGVSVRLSADPHQLLDGGFGNGMVQDRSLSSSSRPYRTRLGVLAAAPRSHPTHAEN